MQQDLPREVVTHLLSRMPDRIGRILARVLPGLDPDLPVTFVEPVYEGPDASRDQGDLVILLGNPNKPDLAVVVELQLEIVPGKPLEWARYKVDARARWCCPAEVWILAPDPEVASWASQPVDEGLLFRMVHLVLGSESFPGICFEDVSDHPPAAVLCALLQCRGVEDVPLFRKVLFLLAFLPRPECIGYGEVLRRHLPLSFTRLPELSMFFDVGRGE